MAEKKPITYEQIVKKVLAMRKVKETTILLNLQNKKLFMNNLRLRFIVLYISPAKEIVFPVYEEKSLSGRE